MKTWIVGIGNHRFDSESGCAEGFVCQGYVGKFTSASPLGRRLGSLGGVSIG